MPNKNKKGFVEDTDYNSDLKATIDSIDEGRKAKNKKSKRK